MKLHSLVYLLVALSIQLKSTDVFALANGLVTPTAVTITLRTISLLTTEDSAIVVWDGRKEVEFTRSGEAFAAITIDDILIPTKRYIGVRLEFLYHYKVKLDGNKYFGMTGTSFAAGNIIYTTAGGNALSPGAATNVAGTAQYVTGVTNPNSVDVTEESTDTTHSYFGKTRCVAISADDCKEGDVWVGGSEAQSAVVNVMYDTFQSISIDSDTGVITRADQKPFAVLGEPGAAIHLVAVNNTDGTSNVTAIFGSDKKLLSTAAYVGGNGPVTILAISNLITVTSGEGYNEKGLTPVQAFDESTGKIQFAAGTCIEGLPPTCRSQGLVVLDNILQPVGSTVNATCAADTNGALGFTYNGSTCENSTSGAYLIARIVDPKNILGQCSTPTRGACAATNAQIPGMDDTDGYL